jgi:hypothetical protein
MEGILRRRGKNGSDARTAECKTGMGARVASRGTVTRLLDARKPDVVGSSASTVPTQKRGRASRSAVPLIKKWTTFEHRKSEQIDQAFWKRDKDKGFVCVRESVYGMANKWIRVCLCLRRMAKIKERGKKEEENLLGTFYSIKLPNISHA